MIMNLLRLLEEYEEAYKVILEEEDGAFIYLISDITNN